MVLTINPTFDDRRVSHHNVNKTVGQHLPFELRDLAIEARKSNNPLLIECFTDLPTLEELIEDKTAIQIEQAKTGTPSAIPVYSNIDVTVPSITAEVSEEEVVKSEDLDAE